jgi:hypothetical protein
LSNNRNEMMKKWFHCSCIERKVFLLQLFTFVTRILSIEKVAIKITVIYNHNQSECEWMSNIITCLNEFLLDCENIAISQATIKSLSIILSDTFDSIDSFNKLYPIKWVF